MRLGVAAVLDVGAGYTKYAVASARRTAVGVMPSVAAPLPAGADLSVQGDGDLFAVAAGGRHYALGPNSPAFNDTRVASSPGLLPWRRPEFSALIAGALAVMAEPVIDELCLIAPPDVEDADLEDVLDVPGAYSCPVLVPGSTAVRQVEVRRVIVCSAAKALATAVAQDAYNSMRAGQESLIVDCGFEATRVIRVRGAGAKYVRCDEFPVGIKGICGRINVELDKKSAGDAVNIHRLVQTPVHVFEDQVMGLRRDVDLDFEEQQPLFRDISRFVTSCAKNGPRPHSTVIVGGGARLLNMRLLNKALGGRPAMPNPMTAAVRGALWYVDGWNRVQADVAESLRLVQG